MSDQNYIEIEAPKKVKDWLGKRVVAKRPVSNGLGTVPAGTVFTLGNCTIRKPLKADKCSCCGFIFKCDMKGTAKEFLEDFYFIQETQI